MVLCACSPFDGWWQNLRISPHRYYFRLLPAYVVKYAVEDTTVNKGFIYHTKSIQEEDAKNLFEQTLLLSRIQASTEKLRKARHAKRQEQLQLAFNEGQQAVYNLLMEMSFEALP